MQKKVEEKAQPFCKRNHHVRRKLFDLIIFWKFSSSSLKRCDKHPYFDKAITKDFFHCNSRIIGLIDSSTRILISLAAPTFALPASTNYQKFVSHNTCVINGSLYMISSRMMLKLV